MEQKAAVREHVSSGVSPHGARGRIPDFLGSAQAANLLTQLPAWTQARAVMANPDRAQQPVRACALAGGKLLFMAVPNLATVKPFFRLAPDALGAHPERAADRHVAAQEAATVAVEELPVIDFVICGSVAVNHQGVRIGKGAGYSDLEVALLVEAKRLQPEATIVTTVHSIQVIDEELPRAEHDFTVDFIVTPDEIIACSPKHRPGGVAWDQITPEMVKAIPVLGQRLE